MNKKTVGLVAGVVVAGGLVAWLLSGDPKSSGAGQQAANQVGQAGDLAQQANASGRAAGQAAEAQAQGRALKSGDLLPSLAQPQVAPVAAFVPELPKPLTTKSFAKELTENMPLWHQCNHVTRDIAFQLKRDAGENGGEVPNIAEPIPTDFLNQMNGDLKVIFAQDPAASEAHKREIGMVLSFQLEGIELPEPVRMAYEGCLTSELSRTRFELPPTESKANLSYSYRLVNGMLQLDESEP